MTELIHLWQAGDGVARFVSLLLLAMSVCSWVLIFWRGWTLARARADLGRGLPVFWTAPDLGQVNTALSAITNLRTQLLSSGALTGGQ